MQSLRLETSSLIYGTLAIIIFIYPYFMYTKEFFGDNTVIKKGDYFSMVGKVFGLHLSFLFFALAAISIIDVMMAYRPEFSPKTALKYFFHVNENWKDLINLMVHHTSNESTTVGSTVTKETTAAHQVVINFYGVVLAFLMLVIPIISITITMMVAFAKDDKGTSSPSIKIFNASLAYAFIVLIIWLHAMFSSVFVTIFTGVNFSFYEIMSSFWHILLLE